MPPRDKLSKEAALDSVKKLKLMDKILSKCTLTEQDALLIGREINSNLGKRHKI